MADSFGFPSQGTVVFNVSRFLGSRLPEFRLQRIGPMAVEGFRFHGAIHLWPFVVLPSPEV